MTAEQKLNHIDLHVGSDGAWLELRTESGKSFCFQPIQQFGPESHWRAAVLEWANDVQRYADDKFVSPNEAGKCTDCGGSVFHRPEHPEEFDHVCSPKTFGDSDSALAKQIAP